MVHGVLSLRVHPTAREKKSGKMTCRVEFKKKTRHWSDADTWGWLFMVKRKNQYSCERRAIMLLLEDVMTMKKVAGPPTLDHPPPL